MLCNFVASQYIKTVPFICMTTILEKQIIRNKLSHTEIEIGLQPPASLWSLIGTAQNHLPAGW